MPDQSARLACDAKAGSTDCPPSLGSSVHMRGRVTDPRARATLLTGAEGEPGGGAGAQVAGAGGDRAQALARCRRRPMTRAAAGARAGAARVRGGRCRALGAARRVLPRARRPPPGMHGCLLLQRRQQRRPSACPHGRRGRCGGASWRLVGLMRPYLCGFSCRRGARLCPGSRAGTGGDQPLFV